jgi:predicted  nucleic acid-binding Zn-ribbon protein
MLVRIKNHLTSNNYEDKESLQVGFTKVKIEKNELNEDEMKSLNNKITEINNELNKLSESIVNYENNSEFVLNKISDDSFLIGELKTVIKSYLNILYYFIYSHL